MRIGSFQLGTGSLGTGLAVGAGATLLAPIVLPLVGGVLKTVAKGVIKSGLIVYEGGKGMLGSTTAAIEDLTAEAKAEMQDDAPVKEITPKKAPAKKAKKPKAAKTSTAE